MPKHRKQIRKAMLIFASHRLRNRIMRMPETAMTMIMMATALTFTSPSSLLPTFGCLNFARGDQRGNRLLNCSQT
jgi:hypothetical protein